MDKAEHARAEYREWCAKLGLCTISDINREIEGGRCSRLINISETWHEQKLSEIALSIGTRIADKKIIFISGPSSSGKTSFASRLQLHLKVNGINAVPISLDDYYIEKEDMPKDNDGNPDYEALEAIDYRLFNENINDLINGRETMLPRYDFDTASVIRSDHTLSLGADEVIIVEGIHGLNPKIADNIDDSRKFRIYCSALTAITDDNGSRIRSRTTRKIRRIIRDFYFRNSPWPETLSLWPNQELGFEKYIAPYTDSADIVFNSSILYEFGVYREHLEKILENAENDEMKELLELAGKFIPIDREFTPHISIIREFVGGSTLWQ